MGRCTRLVRIGGVWLLAAAGCGGRTQAANGGDASSVSDATFAGLVSSPDAPPDLIVLDDAAYGTQTCSLHFEGRDGGSLCPLAAPQAGATCTTGGAQCEYGSSWDVACDLLTVCTTGEAGLTWQVAIDGCQCPGRLLDAGACPDDGGLAGGGCSAVGASCVSAAGGGCECVLCQGGVPDGPSSRNWVCATSTAGCPATRPRFGDPCDGGPPPGITSCPYPSGCSGWNLDCSDGGYWEGRPWPPPP